MHEESDLPDEVQVLIAIYGEQQVTVLSRDAQKFVLKVATSLPNHVEITVSMRLTIPASYPALPPQIQLDSRYIGDFLASSTLFGQILRIFMHEDKTLWEDVLFPGLEKARELVELFYEECLSQNLARRLDAEPHYNISTSVTLRQSPTPAMPTKPVLQNQTHPLTAFIASDPITDRKSVFIGFCCKLTDPDKVNTYLNDLLQDRRIAKATHNILAWRCTTPSGTSYSDNSDDGEKAAGGRLAHLLAALEVNNVFLVVSRWYGGVQLGADRFKHINALVCSDLNNRTAKKKRPTSYDSAGRDALEKGGFLGAPQAHSRKHKK